MAATISASTHHEKTSINGQYLENKLCISFSNSKDCKKHRESAFIPFLFSIYQANVSQQHHINHNRSDDPAALSARLCTYCTCVSPAKAQKNDAFFAKQCLSQQKLPPLFCTFASLSSPFSFTKEQDKIDHCLGMCREKGRPEIRCSQVT